MNLWTRLRTWVAGLHRTDKRRLWGGLICVGIAFELLTIGNASGDTMSEFVWSNVDGPITRGLVGGLCGWLTYHWTWGKGRTGNRWDLISVIGGFLVGASSAFVR